MFYSIQGDSTFAGLPCLFFRLHGCNLRCSYCDSRYSFEQAGFAVPLVELVREAAKYPRAIVEITGGEPLLQPAIIPLIDQLLAQDRTILLETNGSLPIAPVPDGVHIILDVKCPGSGNPIFCRDNLAEIHRRNRQASFIEMKFVVSSREDYLFAKDFLGSHPLPAVTPILFSPIVESLPLADVAAWMLADEIAARLQPQLHTIIWPFDRRGR
jgi:7-carboxy-7-deazaguanine synthase